MNDLKRIAVATKQTNKLPSNTLRAIHKTLGITNKTGSEVIGVSLTNYIQKKSQTSKGANFTKSNLALFQKFVGAIDKLIPNMLAELKNNGCLLSYDDNSWHTRVGVAKEYMEDNELERYKALLQLFIVSNFEDALNGEILIFSTQELSSILKCKTYEVTKELNLLHTDQQDFQEVDTTLDARNTEEENFDDGSFD